MGQTLTVDKGRLVMYDTDLRNCQSRKEVEGSWDTKLFVMNVRDIILGRRNTGY